MKNLWTTIMVKNMEESLKFYTEVLGLTIDKRYTPVPHIEIAFLGTGESKFELIYNAELKDIAYTDHVSTGFQIDSADDYIKYLKTHQIDVDSGPFEPSPFIKFFFIKDPNGYRIQLVEQK